MFWPMWLVHHVSSNATSVYAQSHFRHQADSEVKKSNLHIGDEMENKVLCSEWISHEEMGEVSQQLCSDWGKFPKKTAYIWA